jgi:hypothetical protein
MKVTLVCEVDVVAVAAAGHKMHLHDHRQHLVEVMESEIEMIVAVEMVIHAAWTL